MPHRLLPEDASIGDRVRRLRAERGVTQEELARAAGVSVDLVKKLEQGRRESARLTSLRALADGLDVTLSDLVGRRPRLDAGDGRVVLGLRDALISPAAMGIEPDDAEPTPPARLHEAVRGGWRAYWSGRFGELAGQLPGLLAEARSAHRHLGQPAAEPLAQAYQLAACLLVHLGREDLAAVGAERGILAARDSGDELQYATLHGTYSWTLLMQARHREAEGFALRAAAMVEPRLSSAAPEHITVWGGLVLWAMAAAAEGGRADAAADHISLARAGAARLARDRHDYEVNFGPTQVAMQTVFAAVQLGRPAQAIAAAQGVRREDLRTISYGRHLLDVAQAQADMRRYDAAAETLTQAHSLAPVWWRHQPPARSLVTDLAERQSRLSSTVRELVAALDGRR